MPALESPPRTHRPATPAALVGKRVLVVDDEPMVRQVLVSYLEREGLSVFEADTGTAALDLLRAHRPDLVILDVMLPEIDGLSVLAEVRRDTSVPVILLTARAEEADRILGLELGADDYVVKPFSPREVVARVRAVMKRLRDPHTEDARFDFDDLVIDLRTREVSVGGDVVPLTPKEFDLLAFLAASPRQVFTRAQLLEHVWGSSADWQDPATVTVHIRRLRQKIEPEPDAPRRVLTVWGVGYRMEP